MQKYDANSLQYTLLFRNGSSYDYHFIIKELAKEFKTQFTCLGENTEKYILYSSNRKRDYKN